MSDLSWATLVFIAAAAPVAGRLLDAAARGISTDRLRTMLFQAAIHFDEMSYVYLWHRGTRMTLALFDRWFTEKWNSRAVLVTSGCAGAAVFIAYWLRYVPEGVRHTGTFDIPMVAEFLRYVGLSALIVAVLNSIAMIVSLYATRYFLRKMQPTPISLIGWGACDLAVVYLLSPLPLYGHSLHTMARLGLIDSSYAFWLAVAPWDLRTFGGIDVSHFSVLRLSAVLMYISAAAPTLVHLSMVFTDIGAKVIAQPAWRFTSNVAEYVSNHKEPLTWMGAIVGGLILVAKAASQLWAEIGICKL